MTTEEKHRLKIARQTMQMSDAMAAVMGGMTKDEARAIIEAHDAKLREKRNADRRERHQAMTDLGLKRVRGALGGTYYE